ncbi:MULTISPECIES: CRISPR-associated endonuclease Cas2 [unclassified Roseburia]|jgi:CRISPR-associated protein Cas2|uniref:CRISPR-associated endonuclease Cas2 n=2 Tax=unclassified Roseburia TaxID=2637578 RepID=UPI002E8E0167|nr:CRISPR-associated endonuclease Cas2 [Roseburia sp. AF25-18LB]
MSYRYMRIMVLFDLPVLTEKQRRDYREFRKYLLKAGFFMMQESVYCKLVQNTGVAEVVQESIRKNKPGEGLVQILRVTEKQFAKMEYVVGENKSLVLDTDERLVIL